MSDRYLPNTYAEFKQLKEAGKIRYDRCLICHKPFNDENTKTELGWRDTQIIGFCETCYDEVFEEKD